jgi:hypothetical protein
MRKFFTEAETLVGHNIIRFDLGWPQHHPVRYTRSRKTAWY